MATKYKYDKDTDYAALMERAAQRGDNAAAAIYEQQRNAKIRGEGMAGQEQTSDYAQYLPIEDVPDYDDTHRREAEALLTVQKAQADAIRMINEANPNHNYLALRSMEAMEKVADGKATKLIVPSDMQNLAATVSAIKEISGEVTE